MVKESVHTYLFCFPLGIITVTKKKVFKGNFSGRTPSHDCGSVLSTPSVVSSGVLASTHWNDEVVCRFYQNLRMPKLVHTFTLYCSVQLSMEQKENGRTSVRFFSFMSRFKISSNYLLTCGLFLYPFAPFVPFWLLKLPLIYFRHNFSNHSQNLFYER